MVTSAWYTRAARVGWAVGNFRRCVGTFRGGAFCPSQHPTRSFSARDEAPETSAARSTSSAASYALSSPAGLSCCCWIVASLRRLVTTPWVTTVAEQSANAAAMLRSHAWLSSRWDSDLHAAVSCAWWCSMVPYGCLWENARRISAERRGSGALEWRADAVSRTFHVSRNFTFSSARPLRSSGFHRRVHPTSAYRLRIWPICH